MKYFLCAFLAVASITNIYAGWDDRYGDRESIHDDQPRCVSRKVV
jgi:hypothetical protein